MPRDFTVDFAYRDGELCAEGVALSRIAAAIGTPFYCYSSVALERSYRDFVAALAPLQAMVCYAVKANSNLAVIATLARVGAGADIVSEGELRRALAAGVPPERIVFSGIGKSREEMGFALDCGIHQLNVESAPELEALSEVAVARGRVAPVALRVNPDVDARTHAKISTGRSENKFGIDLGHVGEVARRAAALPGIEFKGLAAHIGSQLLDLAPYRAAFARLAELVGELRAAGLAVSRLDLGGGVGIPYRPGEAAPRLADYAALVRETVGGLGCALAFEPGRCLVGNAGILVSAVLYRKEGTTRRFLILDAAMNDLIRPTFYEAWHEIIPVRQSLTSSAAEPVDVVGPVCETGDTFALQRALPPLEAGELVAFLSAGAYGSVMSSTYNTRRLVPEVLVRDASFAVIRPRQSYEELLGQDRLPDWLAPTGSEEAGSTETGPKASDRARGAA